MNNKAYLNWSGGKDSAFALYRVLQKGDYAISCLLTSISEPYQRISMHGVRVALLEQQAASIGLPLVQVSIPETPTMEVYETTMAKTLSCLKEQGVQHSIFGDIFLEDLRRYREAKLAEMNLNAVFPLWQSDTKQLIQDFLSLGFKTIVTCVNERYLDKSFAGRVIDQNFLNDLPEGVDPCGEHGEFHSFVFDGPIFKQPVLFEKGDLVYRKYTAATKTDDDSSYDCDTSAEDPFNYGFWYCDLIELPNQ